MIVTTMKGKVGQALTGRVVEAPPATTLRGAAILLDEEHVGAILVDNAHSALGILTERDVVRALADGANPDSDRVIDYLTEDLAMVDEGTSLEEAMAVMRRNEIRHLVITREDVVIGVVSMRGVLEVMDPMIVDEPQPAT